MSLHQPILMQPASGDPTITYTQQEIRGMLRSILGLAAGFIGGEGVEGSSALKVTQRGAGPTFSVDIAAGKCWVRDDDVTNGGTYWCWNDATYNLATPVAPGSGTRHHRVCIQLRNKGENGSWSTYDFVPVIVQDTGSGLPGQPDSAITLAVVNITAGDTSVTNSSIDDYRERVDVVQVDKAADTSRNNQTSMQDDPHMQLLNLPSNAKVRITGQILYDGGTGGTEGDIQWTWRQPSGQVMRYAAARVNTAGSFVGGFTFQGSDTVNAQTTGVGASMAATLAGTIWTSDPPCYAVLQWAQNSNVSANTTVEQRSWLRAERSG